MRHGQALGESGTVDDYSHCVHSVRAAPKPEVDATEGLSF